MRCDASGDAMLAGQWGHCANHAMQAMRPSRTAHSVTRFCFVHLCRWVHLPLRSWTFPCAAGAVRSCFQCLLTCWVHIQAPSQCAGGVGSYTQKQQLPACVGCTLHAWVSRTRGGAGQPSLLHCVISLHMPGGKHAWHAGMSFYLSASTAWRAARQLVVWGRTRCPAASQRT